MTGSVTPFRYIKKWNSLSKTQRDSAFALGEEFWRTHLNHPRIRLIIASSMVAAQLVQRLTSTKPNGEDFAGWGRTKLRRYITHSSVPILHLPHLSRYKLFGKAACEKAIARMLNGYMDIPQGNLLELV